MVKIQVYIEGGCLTAVLADTQDVEVQLIDRDNLDDAEAREPGDPEPQEPEPLPFEVW